VTAPPAGWNDVWEAVADRFPDQAALVHADREVR
jgi:hypothetical protein